MSPEFHRSTNPSNLVARHDNQGYNSTLHVITKRQLNRAANALADLISSLR